MKLSLNYLKLKQEIDRHEVLTWGIFFFLFLGFFYEAMESGAWFTLILNVAFFTIYLTFLKKLLKRLFYSFWTFLGLLGFFIILKAFDQSLFSLSFFSFIASGFLVGLQAYSLWTPIFYPVVSWWEYDFRYRDDLKITVKKDEVSLEGRLTDLRRQAGCVALFKELALGEIITIEPFGELTNMQFKAEIMSRRKYSFGRPFNYGVKFILDENSDDAVFKSFVAFWKSERKLKQKKKFKSEETVI